MTLQLIMSTQVLLAVGYLAVTAIGLGAIWSE